MESENEDVTDELFPLGPGEQLRQAREAKRMELSQVAAETRIPIRHLEAIERQQFDAMPSRTYALAFSRQYAGVVGLDDSEIADLVRAEMADTEAHRTMVGGGMEPGDPAKLPSTGLTWFAAAAAMILAIGAYAFYSTYYGSGSGPASLLAGSNDGDATAEGAQAANSEAQASGAEPSASGQVIFTALEDGVWVRFYELDGERLLEKIMDEGEQYELPKSASEPRINTGRPDLLAITVDGQSVPKLAEEPVVLGDAPISAAALLARTDATDGT